MGKGARLRSDRQMREFVQAESRHRGEGNVDPDAIGAEVENSPQGIAEGTELLLAEIRQRGCVCNPDVRHEAEPGEKMKDGEEEKQIVHTYFSHEPWCPFVRYLNEQAR